MGKALRISRRALLKGAAAGVAVPYIVPCWAAGKGSGSTVLAEGRPAPSNRITLGLIGLGSMGMRHVQGFLQEGDCQILAVCDVDAARRAEAVQQVSKHYGNRDRSGRSAGGGAYCRAYNDFRDLVARNDIDAICISVPDHWHCLCAIMGIRAGKDIYGEKPLALTIAEGQVMVEAVQRYNCVWQTGSWQRSTSHFRFACELVRNERIGRLQRVEVGIGQGYKPGPAEPTVFGVGPQPVMPIPAGFDYEMWLGPAPWAPYTEKRCHWNFRWILDYSGGQVTDWGAHNIDIAHWGMGCDEKGPIEIAGKGVFPEDGLWDAAVDYDFQCTYENGVTMCVGSVNYYPQGVRFIGQTGWVHVTRAGLDAEPKRLLKEKIGPEELHLPRPSGDNREGHRRDFLDCIKTRAQTISPVEIGHRSATVAHLGNIAMLLGRKIRWDPKKEQIIGDSSASRMLSRPIRSPWHL